MNHHAPGQPARWSLQDAKARFSELVRRAGEEGPQHVTVHGREKVVVVSVEEYERLEKATKPRATGQALIDAMRDPRLPEDFTFERESVYSPVRNTDRLFDDE